jgi:hypothetical protein
MTASPLSSSLSLPLSSPPGVLVQTSRPPGVVPLRPLTLGELLDAAVSLLRRNARTLLLAGAAAAVVEQIVLYPLRLAASVTPPGYPPHSDRLGQYWVLLAAGFGTEAVAIAGLGGLAAGAAAGDLLGVRRTSARALPVAVIALVAGAVVGLSTLAGLVPWVFGYGLVGLAVPAAVIERRGPGSALLRSVTMSARTGMRASWIRVAGYLAWFPVRMTLAFGGPLLAYAFTGSRGWLPWLAAALAAAVNAVAYPALACLDGVLYLDTRMRTEGLDIWLGRALRAGLLPDLARVAP